MSDNFDYEEIAEAVLSEHGQGASFKQRFIGFCEHAMENKAEDDDLHRLIENVDLPQEDQTK